MNFSWMTKLFWRTDNFKPFLRTINCDCLKNLETRNISLLSNSFVSAFQLQFESSCVQCAFLHGTEKHWRVHSCQYINKHSSLGCRGPNLQEFNQWVRPKGKTFLGGLARNLTRINPVSTTREKEHLCQWLWTDVKRGHPAVESMVAK